MWGDTFLVTPLVAYLAAKYRFPYLSMWGLMLLAGSLIAWLFLFFKVYAPASNEIGEAHVFGGKVTGAGWLHIVYAAPATWVILMTYLTPAHVSRGDFFLTAAVLTPWTYLGVKKFSEYWSFTHEARIQVAVTLAVIWGATIAHLVM